MNQIEKVRKEIKDFFNPNRLVQGSEESVESPSKNYHLVTSNYKQEKDDANWVVTKVEIYDNQSQVKIFDFFGNDERFFYQWLTKGNIEYLICAEDLYGGQTMIDLTKQKMESFSPDEDGFIWAEFYLSPDGNTLAIIGCFWACPYVIKIYDFQNPLNLPLKELNEIELIDNSEVVLGWLDHENLITDQRKIINISKKS